MPIIEHEGQEYEFPYDMPMEQIKSIMREKFPPVAAPVAQDRSALEKGVNLAAAYTTGRSFGLAPKIGAAMGAPIAKGVLEAREAITGQEAPALRDLYKSGVETYQGLTEQAREDTPKLALAAELAGGLKSGIQGAKTPMGQQMGRALKSGGLGARVAKGVGAGELATRTYEAGQAPVGGERDILLEPSVGLGGLVGGAIPLAGAVGSAGAKALTPKIDESLAGVATLAQKHNIPLSIDQITSSRAVKNLQKVSQELPGSGQSGFRDLQMRSLNKALLESVGIKGDKFTKPVMHKAFTDLGKKFDDMGRGKSFQVGTFVNDAAEEILEDQTAYSVDAINAFKKEMEKINESTVNGVVSGERLNIIRGRLNRLARKTKDQDKAELFKDAENIVVELLTSGDDVAAKAFAKTKHQYKNLLALEPLAAKSKGGNISPALLNNRVSKIYGRAHTRGQAGEIGELAQIGHELLPELGGSDTTQKLLTAGAVTGGLVNPASLAVTGGAIGLNRAMQQVINRNQALVNKAIKGANITEDLMKLPPKEATGLMSALKKSKIPWKGKTP